MDTNLTDVGTILASSRSITLSTHVMPDGDGLGAEIALYHYLTRLGKKVRILNPDEPPERYRFLDRAGIVEVFDPGKTKISPFDLLVIVDTNDPKRLVGLWPELEPQARQVLILDHHPTLESAAAAPHKKKIHIVVDEKSSSIGELLYRLFHQAHDLLDQHSPAFRLAPEIALGLYVSIITDTNSFRYARTTALSHRIAADLIDFGLQPEEIYQNIFSSKTAQHLQLIGEALSKVQETKDGRIAWVEITRELRKKYRATSDDTQTIVNFLLLLKKAEILLLLREEDDGRIKVSLKSKGEHQVRQVAEEFGGGGHDFAAGFTANSTLAAIRTKLIERLEKDET